MMTRNNTERAIARIQNGRTKSAETLKRMRAGQRQRRERERQESCHELPIRKIGRSTHADIRMMRLAGKTHKEIAMLAGVTRQRVQQACSNMGIPQVLRQAQALLKPSVSKDLPLTLRNGKRTPEFSCFNNILRDVRKGLYTVCAEWNPDIVGTHEALQNFIQGVGFRPRGYWLRRNAKELSPATVEWAPPKKCIATRQTKVWNRKISPENVLEIKRLYEQGETQRELAERFFVSRWAIARVLHKRRSDR